MAITALPQESVPATAPRKGLRLERFFTHEGVHPYDEIDWPNVRGLIFSGRKERP